MAARSEWVREAEREGSPFLRPPLISIKWSPVAVGSIAVGLNLIQADSLTHPSPAFTHTHTHCAGADLSGSSSHSGSASGWACCLAACYHDKHSQLGIHPKTWQREWEKERESLGEKRSWVKLKKEMFLFLDCAASEEMNLKQYTTSWRENGLRLMDAHSRACCLHAEHANNSWYVGFMNK